MGGYQRHERQFNKSSTYGLAKAAYSTAMFVKDAINIEYKHEIDTFPVGGLSIPNTGTIVNILGSGPFWTGIPQGIGANQRVGDRIKVQRLTYRGLLQLNTAATITAVRVILFRNKADGGILPSVADFLQTLSVYSGKNEDNRYNTNTLYDEVHVVDVTKSRYMEFDWNKELNWHTQFDAGTSNVSDGGLYMLLIATETVNFPNISGVMRVTYTDD